MSRFIVAALAALILGATGTAYAVTSHVFGHGGKVYVFDSMCHRVTFLPPGITDHEGLNVTAQQAHCLVRRVPRYTRVSVTGQSTDIVATCPAGARVVGGGYDGGEAAGSYPSSSRSWTVTRAHDNHGALTAYAVCATVST